MQLETTTELNQKKVLLAQLHVQNNLDGDLSLETVARSVGASTSHFHRIFKAELGETLKVYVDRLRVEKSLYDIYLSDLSLLRISLRNGFKNPETYARVFRRRFGKLPSAVERRGVEARSDARRLPFELGLRCSRDSSFSVTRLTERQLATARHLGPYESVPPIAAAGLTIWRQLEAFVAEGRLANEPYAYLGIPRDNPESTESSKLRFDLCIAVDRAFRARGVIACQTIEPGYYGVLSHAGPYATLGDSYRKLFETALRVDGFDVDPSNVFELFLDIDVKTPEEHAWSELYLRMMRPGETTKEPRT